MLIPLRARIRLIIVRLLLPMYVQINLTFPESSRQTATRLQSELQRSDGTASRPETACYAWWHRVMLAVRS